MNAPVVFIVFDKGMHIVAINEAAESFGFRVGTTLNQYFHESTPAMTFETFRARVVQQPECRLKNNKTFGAKWFAEADENHAGLWLNDITELVFVQAQVQSLTKPERKFLHQISNLISTTLGYSELIELMLDEDTPLVANRLDAVKRYQIEISTALQQAERLLRREQGGPAVVDGRWASNRHILIVIQDATRTELLAELLKSQQFKVTSFLDVDSAIEFLGTRSAQIDLAILDGVDEVSRQLLAVNSETKIIICGNGEKRIEDDRYCFVPDQPLDINELLTTVLDSFDA
jgi:CheY-like chemotaxis protein